MSGELGRVARKRGNKGSPADLYFAVFTNCFPGTTVIQMNNFIDLPVFGPSFLVEEDVPGSSLNGRTPSELKAKELQFWLKCRGDSFKSSWTKCQLVKR